MAGQDLKNLSLSTIRQIPDPELRAYAAREKLKRGFAPVNALARSPQALAVKLAARGVGSIGAGASGATDPESIERAKKLQELLERINSGEAGVKDVFGEIAKEKAKKEALAHGKNILINTIGREVEILNTNRERRKQRKKEAQRRGEPTWRDPGFLSHMLDRIVPGSQSSAAADKRKREKKKK